MHTSLRADLVHLLDGLADTDEHRAREAWEQLWEASRPYLLRYLSSWLRNPDDREDVVQDTFLRVWAFRNRFENQGEQAWFAFIRRTAYHCMVDVRRRYVQETLSLADLEEPEVAQLTDTADALAAAILAQELYLAADVLWLGLDAQVPPRVHQIHLLAAQLYYLHGKSWREIVRLLSPSGAQVNRQSLDAWLSHEGVLRHLCYRELYYSNDRLVCYLLHLPEPGNESAVDSLAQRLAHGAHETEPPPGVATWDEVWAVLWRYRYGLSPKRMLERADCPYDAGQLHTLLIALRARLPFRESIQRLIGRFEQVRGLDYAHVLRAPGLWQRLALQYCYHEGLSHADILERMAPAAECAGYHLTMGMLNVWLSNGRLVQRLARFYREWKGGGNDEA